MDKELEKLSFMRSIPAAVVKNINEPIEKDSKKGFISIGNENDYFEYLRNLYERCTTLKAGINATTDFVCGNSLVLDSQYWNQKFIDGDLARRIEKDIRIFGGYAVNMLRNKFGDVVDIKYIPFERLRSNEHNTEFYYSKDWNKSCGRVKFITYPAYDENDRSQLSSIYYYNNNKGISTYPTPDWSSATEAAEMQIRINQFHLNSLANGFMGSVIIAMNNGVPSEEQADEIEERILDKYTGTENGSRVVLTFADDRDHSAEITKLDLDDFGERYESLKNRSKEEILSALRISPYLIGLNDGNNNGFSTSEYNDSFKIFNRTVVRPAQQQLVNEIHKLTGSSVEIIPFSIEDIGPIDKKSGEVKVNEKINLN